MSIDYLKITQFFDTIFIYENYPVPVADPQREAVSATFLNAVEKLDYPLAIMAYDTGNQIELIWKYDENHVSPLFVQSWMKAFKQITGEVVHNLAADPESLGYLSEGAHEPLVAPQSSDEPQFSKDKTIHELFEAQVDKQPHAIAVVCGKRQLSYQELNQKSNQLAYHLRELASLAPDDCVALCLERSEMLIVSLLAILKAGAAYVPIDPNYPDLRISQMIKETKARIIITDQADRMCGLCSDSLRPIVDLKKLDEQIQSFPKNNLPAAATNVERSHLAYVIYTSGTTGSPKGVMIEHRAFIATLDAFKIRYFQEAAHLNTFSLTSAMFDIFGLEYGLPLFTGGTVTIGLNAIIDRLDCRDFQFIQMTPHLCEVNLDQLENMQNTLLLVGGEALPKNLLNRIIDRQINLINAYGPTETTIWSTTMPYFFNRREKKPDADRFVKIRSPLDYETAYVLDDHLKPLPLLAIGELYIGGAGLARGYINKPEETKEKFFPDPFRKNSRIYKTGDLVRRHLDGCLEYVGRIDQQVKLRGQRIELSEIENAVNQYRGIEQSAVLLKPDPKGQLSLICYYQTVDGKPKTEEEIKLFLFKIIPGYMVPAIYMHLDKFPLNSNGKLDRKELPEPVFLSDYRNFQGARNPLESQVKKVWEEILGLQDQMIDIRDDFFKLGGNSILAIKLISKINKQYFTNLKLSDIFVHNSIESFVPRIDKLKEGPQIILKLNNTEYKPKMFMIHPGGGGCEVYLPLAKKLESQFSCYGVDYYNLYHDEKIGSVKEIALYYLSEIDKIWEETDREAIHLLGWSLGGQIALEIAYQLEQKGKKNIQLYVLDTILNDEYLETLGSYEDLEKRKELFANYAKGLGYNQEYVDKVRANIHMESILGMQKISGNLDAARIVLFKAMMEDKTLSEVMSRHHEINHYVEQLKFNNIDKVIVHPDKLVLYEVPNTDHGSILEQLEFLVPRIASDKFI